MPKLFARIFLNASNISALNLRVCCRSVDDLKHNQTLWGSGKESLLLVINSPGIRKTILLLHKIVNLAKYVQLYGVTNPRVDK